MASYTTLEVNRPTEPHLSSLLTTLRNTDPTVGLAHFPGTNIYKLKKETDWTNPQITAATNAIINAPAATPQLLAQDDVDRFPIVTKALVLALIDEINILRQAAGLQPRTPAQAVQAIRNKAATL
jgi:hypothetical protein